MLEMKCIRAMHFEAELRNENDEVLCSSGAVSLRDDDWVCLSTMETAAGDLHKLLSRNMWRAALIELEQVTEMCGWCIGAVVFSLSVYIFLNIIAHFIPLSCSRQRGDVAAFICVFHLFDIRSHQVVVVYEGLPWRLDLLL